MKLQGSAIEEDGNVGVSTVSTVDLQSIHATLREYFSREKHLEVFEFLQAINDKVYWKIRAYIEYTRDIRIVSLTLSATTGTILTLQEEFRSHKGE